MEIFPSSPEEQQRLLLWLNQLRSGEYSSPTGPVSPPASQLEATIRDLADALARSDEEIRQVLQVASLIGQGLSIDGVLEKLYAELRVIIPYNRIGFSLIDDDKQGVTAYWARSDAPELFISKGYSSELAGSSLAEIMKSGRPRIINDLEAYLAEHPTSDSTARIIREGILSSLTCPLISNGEPIGFIFFSSQAKNTYESAHVHIFQLIASQLASALERGRLIAQLAAQNEELTHANQMKNVFLSMASHDMRSPLAFIKMATSAILDPEMEVPEDQRIDFLHHISSQADHMLSLIDNLMDVTRLESGTVQIKPEALALPDFIADIVDSHSRIAVYKQTKVHLLTSDPGTLTADKTLMRQVLNNLLSNAVKYSPPESEISVWYERMRNGWRISVKDQGPGIQEEDRPKLFRYFTRLSARPTADESCHGLGLAISKQIMTAHNGLIDVVSPPGEGATFYIELPDQS